MNIYQSRSGFKASVIIAALLIGSISLYYTDVLVNRLIDREKEQIELYANALRYTSDSENNEPLTFIYQEIIVSNKSIPVIQTDHEDNIISFKNIGLSKIDNIAKKQSILDKELLRMKEEHPPIKIKYGEKTNLIYFRNSDLIYQLKYYPYAQLSIISIFGILTFMAFSHLRKSEQNKVWVGLAKETAHQLGTPISSLMAWAEYLKSNHGDNSKIIPEIEKDINRLEMITARFSNVGSLPHLKDEDLYEVIKSITDYLQSRISSKVEVSIFNHLQPNTQVKMNKCLFEWVIENICKNAVDAMQAEGKIEISLKNSNNLKKIIIDISDNGKGIAKSHIKRVFYPGFTTKKRGWGLGLTLAKRIIENYHKGKIFVKNSEINKGSTFRILLKPSQED